MNCQKLIEWMDGGGDLVLGLAPFPKNPTLGWLSLEEVIHGDTYRTMLAWMATS